MKLNTSEMKNIASEIDGLVVDYKTQITNLYKKLADMPNGSWSGNQASSYVRYVMLDKTEMMLIGDKIREFTKAIRDSANIIESVSSKTRKDESNE